MGNRGYMQIEEERSENGNSANLGHVYLRPCTSYFNRYEADYPDTHR